MFDIFGYSAERKLERQLIDSYEKNIDIIISKLNKENYELAVAIASIPEHIRGFGHVKENHIEKARLEEESLLRVFLDPQAPSAEAAE